jgi:predicted GNAT family N-acyltransferase
MTLRIVEAAWPEGQLAIEQLRRKVFILEQQVPEALEWDNADADATHFCLFDNSELIAYGRLLLPAVEVGKLTRMAVELSRRRQELGTLLLLHIIKTAQDLGLTKLKLDAQLQAVDFYRRQGFVPEGAVFWDAGIEHVTMALKLDGRGKSFE